MSALPLWWWQQRELHEGGGDGSASLQVVLCYEGELVFTCV